MNPTDFLRSTAVRLAALLSTLMIAGASITCIYIYWQMTSVLSAGVDAELRAELNEVLLAAPDERIAAIEGQRSESPYRHSALFTPDGERIAGDIPAIPSALPLDGTIYELTEDFDGQGAFPIRAIGQTLAGGERAVVAQEMADQRLFRHLMVTRVSAGVAIAVILALAAGLAISVATLRRLEGMQLAATAITNGDLSRRLPLTGRDDDFDKLASVVNTMLDKIETLMDGLKAAGDNIAHDLRTPLTHLRTSLERSLRSGRTAEEREVAIADAIAQTDGILEKFRALLRISEVEEGKRRAAFQTVDLQQIARAVCDLYDPVAADRQQQLALRTMGPAPVLGDRDLLFDLLGNLVDNAIKYTPAGGAIAIVLDGRGAERTLAVEDTGPGIPPELRETMFRRFTRADRARQAAGSGLGLSLVAAVARLHDAEISIRQTDTAFRIAVTFHAIA